ncbi:unnamed protein product [Menidia menidia]|uniref:(Atlantic silverside) hypothetical protein n=1 Tax=Menidia menidia TaxID=238744 RepID=A0A8S4APK3_9TELE|nr:unnamed protein product [Menidia menidia]
MEEQPKDRAQDRQYHHHGEDRNTAQHATYLKHDQSHFQCQHKETQTKKTGNKKVISNEEGDKNPHLSEAAGVLLPSSSNGNRHLSNAHVKPRGAQKLYTPVPKASSKGPDNKKNMDLKNDKEKALDSSHHELPPSDKKDCAPLQNGVVNCGLITNGYSSKDNDGSGSEGGYTTPKKRKTRCNNAKNTDIVTKEKEKDLTPGNTTQELGGSSLETAEKGMTSRAEGHRSSHKPEAQPAESQRKNSDGKTAGTFGKKSEERHKGKLSSPSKEDSWTLFKPPPVFPVDNSSAKIVPKISYASKVKENLNKVAQGGAEAAPPPVRLSQVPMSAMKTITSASFTNGPVSGNGNGCPSVGTFFAPAASSIQSAPSGPSGENVASSLESNCSSTTSPVDGEAYELRNGGSPSSTSPTWAWRGGAGQAEDRAPPPAQPCSDVSPTFLEPGTLSQDPEKRTCAPCQVSNACSPACVTSEEGSKSHPCGQEKTKVEPKAGGSSLVAPGRDGGAKPAQAQLTTLFFGASKEPALSKDIGRRCSWGPSDIKAAVTYHTKDPKRVVIYDETKDGPDQ